MRPHHPEELGFANLEFFLQAYAQWKNNPNRVDPSWDKIFLALDPPKTPAGDNAAEMYRRLGHLQAKISPLKDPLKGVIEISDPKYEAIYCQNVGVEFEGFVRKEVADYLIEQIEKEGFHPPLSVQQKRDILQHLNKAELFENFLQMRYPGQKRFSLEGCETLIPVLSYLVEKGAHRGADEFYLGMAHRGRLNVLCNVLNKTYQEVFSEFSDTYVSLDEEGGDVKYHKGYRSDITLSSGKKVLLHLVDNPSHLESVYPVLLGMTRARQEKLHKVQEVFPIVIHGDAALSGQGVVYEAMQFCQLEGYKTGGTIHVVLNNEIGFTTLPEEGRSTCYCTDIAKAFGCPIFHVNAEDPEAALFTIQLAVELRQKFQIDVFVDLIGYRKYGHNESDEPFFTQPLQYQVIKKKPSVREIYRDQLIAQGALEQSMAEALEAEFKKALHAAHSISQPEEKGPAPKEEEKEVETSFPKEKLEQLARALKNFPETFHPHPKIVQLYSERMEMVVSRDAVKPLDWGMAEALAYGSLLVEGRHVRLTGQDVARGTFTHRQALIVDQKSAERYYPLNHLTPGQAQFDCYNSPLSEYAALAFEYGYSLEYAEALVIWEAQFGDFANGAQIMMDQYISAGEQKWGVRSPLTLFLPHGYEGQGPEHSSARIERFMTLSGKGNMRVCYPSTPAQLFHLVRGHTLSDIKKPLIVFTPKGLLRHPKCVSSIEELSHGRFQLLIEEEPEAKGAKCAVFCSGRIYYDLKAKKEELGVHNFPIIRIEQLYPFPSAEVKCMLAKYPESSVLWVQEEPENMGAWWAFSQDFHPILSPKQRLVYIGRERSATTAVGSHDMHKREHEQILNAVFEHIKA